MLSRVSVVVNTANRAASLAATLEALTLLDYPDFEVVVVNGPSSDGTEHVLEQWSDRIKIGRCAELNLAASRNIGIALAAGDIVAFIDDDAYPDPAWLDRLVAGYDDPEIAGVGGPVYDHTGVALQTRYNLCTRLSDARVAHDTNPAPYVSLPYSDLIVYMIGTNASYLRERLVDVGGFDEEFEYYLDDTEVCARIADQGWLIRLLDDGFVYHKFLESHIRTPKRHFRYRYPIIKNKLYFALRFGLHTHSFYEVCRYLTDFVDEQHRDFDEALAKGWLTEADHDQFKHDVPAAFDAALAQFMTGEPRLRDASWFAQRQEPFERFPTKRPAQDKLHLCFLTLEYPPKALAGIGRVIHSLATGLAAAGHIVHVLTPGDTHDTVDLEHGVWVHRIVPKEQPLPDVPHVPAVVWDYTASLRDELHRIDAHRPVDLVQAPNWGSQGVAAILDGGFTTVLGLYTPLRTITSMDHRLSPGIDGYDPHVAEMIDLEEFCYRNASAYLACGASIVAEIEDRYALTLPADRTGFVAHGLPDAAQSPRREPDPAVVNVLFVGRLEPRKGIDLFLACIGPVCEAHPDAVFTIVGDDTIPDEHGVPYREAFQQSAIGRALGDRVRFCGSVDDDELWDHYARCDVFVAPSRYESFGLILVEAMMFAKPVVAADVGGMSEIVDDGETGFLVPPGQVAPLLRVIDDLVGSSVLRRELGRRARVRYEERYSVARMVEGVNRFYDSLLGRRTTDTVHIARSEPVAAPELLAGSEPMPSHPSGARSDGDASLVVDSVPASVPSGLGIADLSPYVRCTECGGEVVAHLRVVTTEGTPKTGRLDCRRCGSVVATIDGFKYDFHARGRAATYEIGAPPTVVAPRGERRVAPDDPEVAPLGQWTPHDAGYLLSEGRVGDGVRWTGPFTDALLRFRTTSWSGIVDVFLDGGLTSSVDLFESEGSNTVAVSIAADLPLETRTIEIRARGAANDAAHATQVLFGGLVLYGPLGGSFPAPRPLNFGNGYSPVCERLLAGVPDDEMVLECGGGDRRLGRPHHVNFELFRVELADAFGDIHRLPFRDDAFSLVFSQAVFEHVADPFAVARELVRVTKPGGLVLTEVAFMQPLHAAPYHFFNMTPWGAAELFKDCELIEQDWFGPLSDTVDWLLRAVELPGHVPAEQLDRIVGEVRALDPLVSHENLRPVASAVYVVARKPVHAPRATVGSA